jgi:hypothetical protein
VLEEATSPVGEREREAHHNEEGDEIQLLALWPRFAVVEELGKLLAGVLEVRDSLVGVIKTAENPREADDQVLGIVNFNCYAPVWRAEACE